MSVRVLHITRDFPPRSTGGISTAVGGMVRACRAAGVDAAVISFDGWRPKARAGSAERALVLDDDARVARLSTPAQLPAAHAFAERVAPTLVHVHHGMLWPFAAELRARLGVPAILHAHVIQAEQSRLRGLERPTLSQRAQAEAAAQADLVLVPSRAAARLFAGHHPGVTSVRVLGLGIDDSERARRAVRERRTGGPILYAGRFADINGTAELLAAIARLHERVPEAELAAGFAAEFVIAGGIPENPAAEHKWRARFLERAPERLARRVHFLGWQTRPALAELYSRARLVVSPSWLETFGLVILEAMLHGAPIVATRSGGAEELLEHEVTGLLCPPRDVDALVDGMAALIQAPARALALGRAAAEAARGRHLWANVIPELIALYRDM